MRDIFNGKRCTFYKHYGEAGKVVNILDLLTKQGYTNHRLLNDLRVSGYGSDFYRESKKNLSAACFSSVQQNLNIYHAEDNHLYHSGFIQFDIDAAENPILYQPGGKEEMKELLIQRVPYIAYLGSSVSNIGLWGLFPIANRDNHVQHYDAMVKLFKSLDIKLDLKPRNIASMRFLAYDPDAHFELQPEIFEDMVITGNSSKIEEYERPDTPHELFVAACRWVEAKHNYKWQKGYIHNYLLALYSTLRYANVGRGAILNWIFNNLIDEKEITTNCLDEIEIKRIR